MSNERTINEDKTPEKVSELQYVVYKFDIITTHMEDITDLVRGRSIEDEYFRSITERLEKVNRELYETIDYIESVISKLRQTYLN